VPGVEGILLLGLGVTTPNRHHNQSFRLRALVVGLVELVSLTTLISLILLARYLLDASQPRGHALLFAGAVLWLTNVLIFGIWYWELDRWPVTSACALRAGGARACLAARSAPPARPPCCTESPAEPDVASPNSHWPSARSPS
jgi:hypothetical protein